MTRLAFYLEHFGFLAVLALTAYILGRRCLRSWAFDSKSERVSVCAGFGLGLLCSILYAIAVARCFYQVTLIALMILIHWWGRDGWREIVRDLCEWHPADFVLIGLAALALVPFATLPLYPSIGVDANTYHLPYAKTFAQAHALVWTPNIQPPGFPLANEMLFAAALLFSDNVAAQLTQFLMLLLIVVNLAAWGRHMASPIVGWWGAALFVSNPMVLLVCTKANIDLGVTLFATLHVYAFYRWRDTGLDRWLWLSASMCGWAAASKYTALFFVAVFVPVVLWLGRRRWIVPIGFTGILAVVAFPFYLRTWIATGNPFFPFFSSIFGGGNWSADDLKFHGFVTLEMWGCGSSLRDLLMLPWNLTFQPLPFQGAGISPAYLFLLPVVIWCAVRDVRLRGMLAIVAGYFVFWFYGAQQQRYLFVVFPLLSLITATAFARCWTLVSRRVALAHGAMPLLMIAVLILVPGWLWTRGFRRGLGPVPVTQVQREMFLARFLPTYEAYHLLNHTRGSNYALYALYDFQMNYHADGKSLGGWVGPDRYRLITDRFADSRALLEELERVGADHLLIHRLQLHPVLPKITEGPREDAFFVEHFKVIHQTPKWTLYELKKDGGLANANRLK